MTGNQKLMAIDFFALPGLPCQGGPTVAAMNIFTTIICMDQGGSK